MMRRKILKRKAWQNRLRRLKTRSKRVGVATCPWVTGARGSPGPGGPGVPGGPGGPGGPGAGAGAGAGGRCPERAPGSAREDPAPAGGGAVGDGSDNEKVQDENKAEDELLIGEKMATDFANNTPAPANKVTLVNNTDNHILFTSNFHQQVYLYTNFRSTSYKMVFNDYCYSTSHLFRKFRRRVSFL